MTEKLVNVTVAHQVRMIVDDKVVIPTKPKNLSDWTPMRYGVLLNEYMYWVTHDMGTKAQFVTHIYSQIQSGRHPLLKKNPTDVKPYEEFSIDAIRSQIDLLAEPENKVIVKGEFDTHFNPSNLFAVTCKKKGEEAKRSYLKKKEKKNEVVQRTIQDQLDEMDSENSTVTVTLPRELAEQIAQYL